MSNKTLSGQTISDTYPSLLQINNLNYGYATIEDGLGNISPLTVYTSNSSNLKIGNLQYPTNIPTNNICGLVANNNILSFSDSLLSTNDGIKIENVILPQSVDDGYIIISNDGSSISTNLQVFGDLQVKSINNKLIKDLHNISDFTGNEKIYQIWLMGYVGDDNLEISGDKFNGKKIILRGKTTFYDIINFSGSLLSNINITGGNNCELYITQISYVKDN